MALCTTAGLGAVIGVAFQSPQQYESHALVRVNPEHIDQQAVAAIFRANHRLEAEVAAGLVQVKITRGYRNPLKDELATVLVQGEARARALIPDYASEHQAVLAHLQDTLALVNNAQSPEERLLLSARLEELIDRMHKLQALVSTTPDAFMVISDPTEAIADGPRVEIKLIVLAIGLSAGFGLAVIWLLHYSKVYRQAQGSLSQP